MEKGKNLWDGSENRKVKVKENQGCWNAVGCLLLPCYIQKKKKKNPHSCVLLEINYIIWIRWTVGRNRGISGSRKTLNLKNTLGLSIYLCHLLSVWLTEHSSSFPNLNFLTSKVEMLLSNGDELKFGHQDFWSLVIDPWICYFPWQKGLCRCN